MIKGKFVGKVSISIEIPNDDPNLRPYDDCKREWETVPELIKRILQDECGEEFAVHVETLESELTKTDD